MLLYVYVSSDCFVSWFRWVLLGIIICPVSCLHKYKVILPTYICPVSPLSSVTWIRWVLVGLYMSGESSTGILRIYFQFVLCHLILVSPWWNIYVWWVLLCILLLYVYVSSFQWLLCTLIPVSPLKYTCLVSPLHKYMLCHMNILPSVTPLYSE